MTQTTRIRTPFGFDSTAADVVAGIDLSAKRAIVTGAGSGIGVETARALALAGAEVTMAVRRTGDADPVAADIRASTGNDRVIVAPLELTDDASVAAFVTAWDGPTTWATSRSRSGFTRPGCGRQRSHRLSLLPGQASTASAAVLRGQTRQRSSTAAAPA